jgi:hypothetical protein
MEGFTREQVERATEARNALAIMSHPPAEKMKRLVSTSNVVKNIPFDASDLTNGELIFGKDRGAIRGKTTRKKPSRVRPVLVTLPRELFEHIRNVTLAADVMFCNGLPFFVIVSRDIKLITVEFLPSRTVESLCSKLKKVLTIYRRGGFAVRTCLMDMEFKPLVEDFDEALINVTAAREHVGDVERAIRFIEERARSIVSELPFKHCMPDQFIIHLMMFVTLWINAFPSDSGVSDVYSPREIVTGMKMDYQKHCKARFGSYVEASVDPTITNTLQARTTPCIVLGPTGNLQGAVKCYSLETKQILDRRDITPLLMPDRVIKRVVQLGKKAKQQRMSTRLQFLNRHKEKFDWDIDEPEETAGLIEAPPATDPPAEIPGVLLESDFNSDDDVIEKKQSYRRAAGRSRPCQRQSNTD